jgi:hypothetical protein
MSVFPATLVGSTRYTWVMAAESSPKPVPLVYANAMGVLAGGADLSLDFGYRTWATGPVWAVRVVMSWEHAVVMCDALGEIIERYETDVGEIRDLKQRAGVGFELDQMRAAKLSRVGRSPELSYQRSPELSDQPSPELSDQPSPELSYQPSPELSEQPSPELSEQRSPELSEQPSPELSEQRM